jgi:hypothetical protein
MIQRPNSHARATGGEFAHGLGGVADFSLAGPFAASARRNGRAGRIEMVAMSAAG